MSMLGESSMRGIEDGVEGKKAAEGLEEEEEEEEEG